VEETGEEETGQPELSDFSPRRKAPPRQMRLTQANCRRLRSWPEREETEETGQPELSDFSPRRKAPRQMRLTQANCRRLRSWPEQRNNRAVQADPFCSMDCF
jgi:hypothetical protein